MSLQAYQLGKIGLMTNKLLSIHLLILSTLLVFLLFLWQGNSGFNLWDEGFLWYGAQRVMLGEVPIRDFMAYEPGRYYWSATLMHLLWGDNSIMALRGSVAIFQVVGLFVGLILIARTSEKPNILYILLSAITFVIWMFPRHKLFDISLSIMLMGVLTFLIQNPTSRRYFFAGLCLGLVATFGRNHGVYGAMGSIGVIAWLRINEKKPKFVKGLVFWTAGVALGFIPIFFMVLFIPGFSTAFWDSIRFLFEIKSTNLPLPIPWPWLVNFSSGLFVEEIRQVLVGLFFMGIIVFGLLSVILVVREKILNRAIPAPFVAAAFMALPYTHYAYSRADLGHLAQGIFPFLMGCLVLLATQAPKIKWSMAPLLCGISLWVVHSSHPGWRCRFNHQCVKTEISGHNLFVEKSTLHDIELLRELVHKYAPGNRSFVAVPYWPGSYALFERKSPLWEIYALFPRSPAFQEVEVDRIKKASPGFILILDLALDGRNELRFQNTHPQVYKYIVDNFMRIPYTENPSYQIYKVQEKK